MEERRTRAKTPILFPLESSEKGDEADAEAEADAAAAAAAVDDDETAEGGEKG